MTSPSGWWWTMRHAWSPICVSFCSPQTASCAQTCSLWRTRTSTRPRGKRWHSKNSRGRIRRTGTLMRNSELNSERKRVPSQTHAIHLNILTSRCEIQKPGHQRFENEGQTESTKRGSLHTQTEMEFKIRKWTPSCLHRMRKLYKLNLTPL